MKAVLIIFAWVVALIAAPVRIYDANVQNAGGNPADGRLEVQLSAPCTDVSTGRTYTQEKLTVPVAAGVVDVSLQPTTACRQLNVWYEVIYILSNDSEWRRRVWRVPQSGAPHLVSAVEYEAPPAWGIPIGPKLTRTDQGLDLAPGVLDASDFANNAISNAKLADMAAATLKGNNTGGTADPLDLTVAQVKALLGYSAADLSNGVTGSGAVVLATSPILVTPVIASLANATHTHQNAAGGGTLDGAAIATGTIDVGRISQAAVTQHQAALSVATSQLTGTLPDARVAASSVTQHQSALAISQSQVTGLVTALAGKAASAHAHDTGDTTSGTFANARIAASNVTQHQAALAIGAAQVGAGTVSDTEYGYLDGVTSAIQTQLNGKAATSHNHSTANNNTAIGSSSLISNTTGNYNAASGYFALYSNTTGSNNAATGAFALASNTTGNSNTAEGYAALYANTTGSNNAAIGYEALRLNTTGSNNTATGYEALYSTTAGNYNTATGAVALFSNTTGNSNTAEGYAALYANTTGSYNAAIGYVALRSNTTGNYNAASGYFALYSNTTGSNNAATGALALASNTTGNSNTAEGYAALYANTTGSYNAASGYAALYANTTGSYNAAIGYEALRSNTTGSNNTASGVAALTSNTTGSYNAATGYEALYSTTAGNYNAGLGYRAGHTSLIDVNSVFVGAMSTRDPGVSTGTSLTNMICVGYDCKVGASNTAVIGNSAIVETVLYGKIRLATSSAPASASEACTAGQTTYDSSFIYVCVAGAWKRTQLTTW